MKTRILVIFLSIILLWSCDNESILGPVDDIDPISEKFVTITASSSKGGVIDPVGDTKVKVGSSITYKFTADTCYMIESIKVKGTEQLISKTYEFKNILVDSDIKVSYVLINYKLIINHKWYLQKSELQYVKDGAWYEQIPEPKRLTSYRIFGTDDLHYIYDKENKLIGGPYEWSFSGKGLEIGDENYIIELLNENKMILIITIPSAIPDVPFVDIKLTYVHS